MRRRSSIARAFARGTPHSPGPRWWECVRSGAARVLLAALLAAFLAGGPALPAAGAEAPPTASPLPPPGATIQRSLDGGESHRYGVEVPPGHFLRVVAEQQGIDVVIRLLGPDGGLLFQGDSPNGRQGPEPLSFIGPLEADPDAIPRRYVVEVASPKPGAAAAGYTLRTEALRPALSDDAKTVRAERLEAAAAVDAWVEGTAESRRRAIDGYLRALDLWEQLGDRGRQATALNNLAFVYTRVGDLAAEATTFRRLLELREQQGEEAEIARVRLNLATSYFKLGRFDEAEVLYRRSLEHFEAHGDLARAAAAWNGLGSLHWRLGRLEAARNDFLRALETERREGDVRGQAVVLNNLGLVERILGHTGRGEEMFREALELARQVDDLTNMAASLNNLGVAAEAQGRIQEALEHHREVREIERQRGNRRGEAYALHNLGYVYLRLGKPEEAAEYFRDALALNRATGERVAEARTLTSLGRVRTEQELYGEAQRHLEAALELARALEDRRLEATVLTHLGHVHRERGAYGEALVHLEKALVLCREVGLPVEESEALSQVGRVYIQQGRPERAEEPLRQAMESSRRLGHVNGEARGLFALALARRAQGDLEGALGYVEGAVQVVETLRQQVHIPELRSTLFANRREYHEAWVDLLMELHDHSPRAGWDVRAFEAAERARARSLGDLLQEAEVDLRRDADPRLVERARELGRQLNALERRRLETLDGEGTDRDSRLAELAERIRETRKELQWVETEMRRSSPRYASLTGPVQLDLGEVQEGLLDPRVVLLQYSLGEERSFLWRISRDSFVVHQLPAAEVLETAARRLHEALRNPGSDAEATARELGRLLLGPVAGVLEEADTVAVVADGALHFVPFAALHPGDGEAPYRPLVRDHRVVHLPSVAALTMLREQDSPSPDRLLAIFADPVFQADDPRLGSDAGSGTGGETLARAEAGAVHRGGDTLEFRRLRFSRREAEQIAHLVPEDRRLLSFDFEASRETLEATPLDEYRYLHFATHGVLDSRYPELSGLVLSLVDPQARPREGFLRLHEIYGLELDAEVVTLSACSTALGQEIEGEGLVGLTRGFMYAGAKRVVASLWDVQDRATAEVMVRFYRGMLEEGLAPAEALRRAQVETLDDPRWSHPYYWAAFVLQGDWR